MSRARPTAPRVARAVLEHDHEMQVAAADPAVRHLDEHLARARRGNGELLHDRSPMLALRNGADTAAVWVHVTRGGNCRDR